MAQHLKITQANQLTWDDLGRTVRLVGADGTSYEGALTYLSFFLDDEEPVTVVMDHKGGGPIYLATTHLVEVEW